MRNYITASLAIMAVIGAQAQDFNVKKGIITINKKEIAKIDRKGVVYKFTSLDDKTTFWAEVKSSANNNFWLQLKGENGNVQDMEMKNVPFTLSKEKQAIMAVYFSADGLITEEGINSERATELFQSSNKELSDKWNKIDGDRKVEKAEETALLKKANINVTDDASIMQGADKIGFINTKTTKQAYSSHEATIADIKGNVIAKVSYDETKTMNAKRGVTLTTYDDKQFDLTDLNYFMDATDPIKANPVFIAKLYANGYKFGDMTQQIKDYRDAKTTEKQEEYNKHVVEARGKSRNIYDQEGYVIDKKGTKHTGLVTIEFESVPRDGDYRISGSVGIADVSSYGNSVAIKTDKKRLNFKAKEGVEFGVGNERYIGTPTSDDGGLGNSNGELDVFGGSSKFLIVDYDNGGNMVLHHLKTPDGFYLLLKGQKKAIYLGNKSTFGTRKEDTTKKLFDKYVNCSALQFSNYDTNTFEGLKKLVDDYVQSCN
ncbi:hypothetical protein HX049_12515 [Myroides odoratimimus]|uniref:hypothetical protein n=1 Tax=Myroides odoratimimus TaxID=76832 RepID=UPI002574FC7F|nr:hypothetical protein [Myroides odoratimimus]MDM1397996.1 hypothetical protein [Myroides odoratimimus]